MTSGSYGDSIVNAMLGWLKGLADWVLRLFNLAGNGKFSPLAWLSQNWLKLLIILLIIGVVTDLVVWLFRWRPYWVWFGKKRVIINDEHYFSRRREAEEEASRKSPKQTAPKVHASTVVHRERPFDDDMPRPKPVRRESVAKPTPAKPNPAENTASAKGRHVKNSSENNA